MMECNVTDHMPVDTQEIQRVMISLVSSSLAPFLPFLCIFHIFISISLHFSYIYLLPFPRVHFSFLSLWLKYHPCCVLSKLFQRLNHL